MTSVTMDFETRSLLDLRDVGLYRYAEHESTEPICLSWMVDDDPYIRLWHENMPPPIDLFELIIDPNVTFHAFNAQFEIEIWDKQCHKHLGWPAVPPLDKWRDTMAECGVAGYPQKLDEVLKILGGPLKIEEGKKLINELSKPIKKGPHAGQFIYYNDAPDRYHKFYKYNKRDVQADRWVQGKVSHLMTREEYDIWRHVVTMNRRGMHVDTFSLDNIQKHVDKQLSRDCAVLTMLTDGEVEGPTQVKRIRDFIELRGTSLPNLKEDTVESLLKDTKGVDPTVVRILEIRRDAGKASIAKFKKIKSTLCNDGTVKGCLRYYGAGPGRHSGLGFQPQNLPRFKLDNPEEVLAIFNQYDTDVVSSIYKIIQTSVGLVRPIIRAADNHKLIVSDFHSVESIAIPWALEEENLLNSIRAGADLYTSQAASMYALPYDSIDYTKRQAGKVAVLGCGYAGGAKVFVDFAAGYGLDFTLEESKKIVSLFRKSRPKVVRAWSEFGVAACTAMVRPGEMVHVVGAKGASFVLIDGWLCMRLPSGRYIYYPKPEIVHDWNDWGNMEAFVKAGHIDSRTKRWNIRKMTGALFFQNYIQGLCRDLLTTAQLRLEAYNYPQIGSIHDEGVGQTPDTPQYSIEEYNSIMSQLPHWAEGFPLNCEGYEGYRYRKG